MSDLNPGLSKFVISRLDYQATGICMPYLTFTGLDAFVFIERPVP